MTLLSDLKIRKAESKKNAYTPSDGGGLALHVASNGTKTWLYRFYWQGKQQKLSFGQYPVVDLKLARTLRHDAKTQLANPHARFEQVIQACKMAEIHDVIEALPQGYQTEIGERGVGLSGGQKQRIAIARALLKQPRILIFDEATSNLDQQTAEHFANTINALKGKVTMVFITHALPQALKVDQIIRIGAN